MPVNTVTPSTTRKTSGRVKDFENGTLVRWSSGVYVVLLYKDNSAQIGAVSLSDGGYLTPETIVEIVPAGEVITIMAGE